MTMARPLAIGILRNRDAVSAGAYRRAHIDLALEANTLGYAIVYIFTVFGDAAVDACIYDDAERLARNLDAEALVVTLGTDRTRLASIAERIRMTVHYLNP